MADIKSISATSYSTYETCPYSWKMRYVYNLLIPEVEAFIIGKTLHRALELYHRNTAEDFIISELKEQFLYKPVDKKRINDYALVKQMFDLYKKYPLGGKTSWLEYEFRISLPNIAPVLYGFIDRLTADNEIIDYKTSGKDFATKDANNIQAEIYSYAVNNITGKPAKVIFYVINKNKVKRPDYIPQVITVEPNLDNFLSKMQDFYRNIQANNFNPKTGIHCKWCLYRNYCKHKRT